MFIKKTTLSII